MASGESEYDIDLAVEMRLMALDDIASLRKVRLFCCACARRAWKLLTHPYRQAVELAEHMSDSDSSSVDANRVYSLLEAVRADGFRIKCARRAAAWSIHPSMNAGSVARSVASSASQAANDRKAERASQLALLEDIFADLPDGILNSNFSRSRVGGGVISIATAAYKDRLLPSGQINPDSLKSLADALEDAGCEDQAVLSHCRSDSIHTRGCWVLDAVLGKI